MKKTISSLLTVAGLLGSLTASAQAMELPALDVEITGNHEIRDILAAHFNGLEDPDCLSTDLYETAKKYTIVGAVVTSVKFRTFNNAINTEFKMSFPDGRTEGPFSTDNIYGCKIKPVVV